MKDTAVVWIIILTKCSQTWVSLVFLYVGEQLWSFICTQSVGWGLPADLARVDFPPGEVRRLIWSTFSLQHAELGPAAHTVWEGIKTSQSSTKTQISILLLRGPQLVCRKTSGRGLMLKLQQVCTVNKLDIPYVASFICFEMPAEWGQDALFQREINRKVIILLLSLTACFHFRVCWFQLNQD